MEIKTTRITVKQATNLLQPTQKVKKVFLNPEKVQVPKEVVSLAAIKKVAPAVAPVEALTVDNKC